jgi:hypothetical protein
LTSNYKAEHGGAFYNPSTWRLRQEALEFKTSLGYREILCLKKKQTSITLVAGLGVMMQR